MSMFLLKIFDTLGHSHEQPAGIIPHRFKLRKCSQEQLSSVLMAWRADKTVGEFRRSQKWLWP
jgi:hypothetical protein